MSIETRTYDDEHGEPVVVIVTKGDHDVSRLVHLFASRGNCEQNGYGRKIARQLRRHNSGRAALALLRDHGGADFTAEGSGTERDTQ